MNLNASPHIGETPDGYGSVGVPSVPSQNIGMPLFGIGGQAAFSHMPGPTATSAPRDLSPPLQSTAAMPTVAGYTMVANHALMDVTNLPPGGEAAMMASVQPNLPPSGPAHSLDQMITGAVLRQDEDDETADAAAAAASHHQHRSAMMYQDMKGMGNPAEHGPQVEGQDQGFLVPEDEVDRRSVFVGNVDYGATPPELQEHFKNCGAINRITIMVDRYSGHPKGYAYIEFQEESAIPNAVTLSQSIFRDRPLKVTPKRKNIPGYSSMLMARGGRGGGHLGMPPPSRGGFGRGYPPPFLGRGRGGMRGFPGYFPRYRGRGQRAHTPY